VALLAALFAIGTAVVTTVKTTVDAVKSFFREQVMKTVDRTLDVLVSDINRLQQKIRDQNNRIEELEEKFRRDNSKTISEREEYEYLESERNANLQKWGEVSAERYAAEQSAAGQRAELVLIDESHLHIAQGHVGYTNFHKRCKHNGCRRFLQLRRQNVSDSVQTYFWTCPSFFEPQHSPRRHSYTEPFQVADAALFAQRNIEDWQTPARDLERLARLAQAPLKKRVSEHVGESVERTVCGVHGEPLALHQRNSVGLGLLETYQLVCARPQCGYKVNITTVGQLTALLAAAEGKGIL
jgi:hypothetical protein